MDNSAIVLPGDTPLRRCRVCDVPQLADAEHFRPQPFRPLGVQVFAQRCRACDAAAARGDLLTGRERARARRQALAASLPVKGPSDLEVLRARNEAERVRAVNRHRAVRAQAKQPADD